MLVMACAHIILVVEWAYVQRAASSLASIACGYYSFMLDVSLPFDATNWSLPDIYCSFW
jgi:hypothetical protein